MASRPTGEEIPAYKLALSKQAELYLRAGEAKDRIAEAGSTSIVHSAEKMIDWRVAPAINMGIAQCVRMLEHGAWLNIYELTRLQTGYSGKQLSEEIRKRLSNGSIDWYERRRAIEELFEFSDNVHYAALHVGGAGASRYGDCCVVVDRYNWHNWATCFGGDSLRTCFDVAGNRMLPDSEALELFAVGADWWPLMLVKHESYFDRVDLPPGLDMHELQTLVEDPDSLIEVHLHGAITRADITAIMMPRKVRDRHFNKYREWERKGRPQSHEFEMVSIFADFLRSLKTHRIAFQVTEE
jgi:hypothetical protein